jgi:hypothetical protein
VLVTLMMLSPFPSITAWSVDLGRVGSSFIGVGNSVW